MVSHPRAVLQYICPYRFYRRWLFLEEKATLRRGFGVQRLENRYSRKNKNAARVGHPVISMSIPNLIRSFNPQRDRRSSGATRLLPGAAPRRPPPTARCALRGPRSELSLARPSGARMQARRQMQRQSIRPARRADACSAPPWFPAGAAGWRPAAACAPSAFAIRPAHP